MPVSYRETAPAIRTLPKVLPQEGERAYSVDGVRPMANSISVRAAEAHFVGVLVSNGIPMGPRMPALEERELVERIGDAYGRYKCEVPQLDVVGKSGEWVVPVT